MAGGRAQPGALGTLRWQTDPMAVVRETKLPGVGVRHDFTTESGGEVGVLVYRDGRRDIVAYDSDDPDSCSTMVTLSSADSRTMTELLGGSQVTEAVGAVLQQIEGLAIEWVPVEEGSEAVGKSITDGAYRTRTGASIVAVARHDTTIPAPEPDFVFAQGDVVVAVGTLDGLKALKQIVESG